MNEIIPLGLLLLMTGGYLIYHFRGRPRPSSVRYRIDRPAPSS